MADNIEFNLKPKQAAERKLMATFVDVSGKRPSEQDWTPIWEILGAGIEDSSVALNPDKEKKTDILGFTETSINKMEEEQTFEPNTLRGGQKLNAILLDMVRRRTLSEFTMFTVMRAYQFIGGDGAIPAHYDVNCTITPSEIGGASYVDMPMSIDYSGDRTHGTIDKMINPTFTPDNPTV